ncbi:MAG: hypothetical protein OEW21_09490 [Betaproteobacteria bacterium]|nr:hypothetical protein [Betaproteobacteria bacterium]
MMPGPFAGEARSRLLPMSVPFRYFGAAVVFQILAWTLLARHADQLAGFAGGPSPLLGALHLVTLGVLAMTACGASLQLLPIATRQPVRSVAAAKLAWWLLVAGVVLFALGALRYHPPTMGVGALVALLGLAVYAWLLAENLRRARGMRVVVAHAWVACCALLLTLASGFALAQGYVHGFRFDRAALALAHLTLAAYGFMGMLALGLSYFLLPMFALCPAPGPRSGYASLGAAASAIVIVVIGQLSEAGPGPLGVAALLGLAAALSHIVPMELALRRRLRPALSPSFLLVRVSWAMLLASLVVALASALGWGYPRVAPLFGLLLVPGWLLSFNLAVLQRIVPFLASVHAYGSGRGSTLPSTLTSEPLLAAHRALHLLALAGLLLAVALDITWLARSATLVGLAGALAFAAFFLNVVQRLRAARTQPPTTGESP